MMLNKKLQTLRKELKLTQEDLAERLNISRQAIAKWESGKATPDIDNLILLSGIFGITIDSMVKDTNCTKRIPTEDNPRNEEIISFLCKAKRKTYAGKSQEESVSSRKLSHDLFYNEGNYEYFDTYLGGEKFTGEEAVWCNGIPIWAMNYSGRVLGEDFLGDFLKEALLLVPKEAPFRGPALHQNGVYTYHCTTNGDFQWFQGKEEIFSGDKKVYECYFHGGSVK